MKKTIYGGIVALMMGIMLAFTGCASPAAEKPAEKQAEAPKQEVATEPHYITKEDLKTDLADGKTDFVVLDVRKAADYTDKHFKGAISADVDSAINGNDTAPAIANVKAALKQATGSETGSADKKYLLVCYSGKRYAEATTGFMKDMGIPADNIYILEGGQKGWVEGGDEYAAFLEN